MRTLTISLTDSTSAMEQMKHSAIRAWKTGEYQGERISYATPAQLFKVFTQKRWEMIAYLQTLQSPVSIRELARKLKRDVRRVHDDVQVLLREGYPPPQAGKLELLQLRPPSPGEVFD